MIRPDTDLTRAARSDRTAVLLDLATGAPEARRAELLREVVEINVPVAEAIARRYVNRGIETDDLVQVACLAVTRAAERFEAGPDRAFLSFAVPTIRGEIKKHFRDHGWTVRPSRRVQEAQGRIAAAEAQLQQELGRSPRPAEIAELTGLDLDTVIESLAANGCFSPTSLDLVVSAEGSGTTIGDLLASDDVAGPAADARVLLAPAVRGLKERDRRILAMRFFEDLTQQEIGDELGITQMQVSRLLTRIMRDLRRSLAGGPARHQPGRRRVTSASTRAA